MVDEAINRILYEYACIWRDVTKDEKGSIPPWASVALRDAAREEIKRIMHDAYTKPRIVTEE